MSSSEVTETPAPPIHPLDLAAERDALGPALGEAVQRVLASGRYVSGPEVERLESSFAKLAGVDHAVAVASGTDALVLGLHALGVQPGDHVLTTPFSFFATAGTIAWLGARPTFCDIEPETALMDAGAAAAAITSETRAIVPVHLYGQLVDMRAFRTLADEHGLGLLEDGAQSHGAHRDGIRAGELGDACTLSFYPTKNLGAAGEGGMVLSRDRELAGKLSRLRDHGMSAKYLHSSIGTNSRMDEIQAAVLNVKFPHLADWNARRRASASRYDEAFAELEHVQVLSRPGGPGHVFHQYAVRVPGPARDEVLERLREQGVNAAVHYPTPIHLQPAAREWGHGPGDFPHAERLAAEVLCLPIHPFLGDAELDRVIAALGAATS